MAAIANVALLVADYDEAIAFYTGKLGFDLLEDTALGGGKRWVQVAPKNNSGTALLLAKASNEKQQSAVGDQAGGDGDNRDLRIARAPRQDPGDTDCKAGLEELRRL